MNHLNSNKNIPFQDNKSELKDQTSFTDDKNNDTSIINKKTNDFEEHKTGHWEIPIKMCDIVLLLFGDIDKKVSNDLNIEIETQNNIKKNLNLSRSLIVSLKGIQEASLEEEKYNRREKKQHFQLERRIAVLEQYKERYEMLQTEKVF